MALSSVTFTGSTPISTPISGPIVGVAADGFGPRYGLGLGVIACLAAAIIGTLAVRRVPPAERHAQRPVSSTGPPANKHTKPADDCPGWPVQYHLRSACGGPWEASDLS